MEGVWSGVDDLGRVRRQPLAEIALVLLVILILVAPTREGVWTGVVAAWYMALALLVAVVARPMPAQVFLPCLAALVCSGLLFVSASTRLVWLRRHVVVAVLLLVAPMLAGLRSVAAGSALHTARTAEFDRDWAELNERSPRLVVAWKDGFPYELVVSPLRERSGRASSVAVAGINTLTRTPFTRESIRIAGIHDLHVALMDSPGVVIVARETLVPVLEAFLLDRYRREVVAECTFSGETFTAWRLVEGRAESDRGIPSTGGCRAP